MLSRLSTSSLRQRSKLSTHVNQLASLSTVGECSTVQKAWEKSCYFKKDYTISEDSKVFEAVEKFAAYECGALITTDSNGKMAGVVTERDYIKKIALLGRTSKETPIKDIHTQYANIVSVLPTDSIETCMSKMMTKSIRHLPILDSDEKVVGMVSIKDLAKVLVEDSEREIQALSDFALGKGSGKV